MSLHVEIIPVTLFRQNCTLMWDDETNEAVFTDVGGKVPQLMEEAEKRGLTVKAVWLTHGHLDHVSGVSELTALRPDLEVLGPHEADRFLLANLTEITKQYDFPPAKPFMPPAGWTRATRSAWANTASKCCTFPATPPATSCFTAPKPVC